MAKSGKLHNLEKFIIAKYAFKQNFYSSKVITQVMILIIFIQPLFFTLESTRFSEYQENWIYTALKIIFRPDVVLAEELINYRILLFLLPLFFWMLEKIILIVFIFNYFGSQNPENIIQSIKNSLVKSIPCIYTAIYQSLISSYLFNCFFLICLKSLQTQMNEINNFNYFLIGLNFLTIIFLIIDMLINFLITEAQVTNRTFGLDKLKVTKVQLFCRLITIIMILLTTQSHEIVELILSVLITIWSSISLFDQFTNIPYPLTYQQFPFFLGTTINFITHIAFIISSSLIDIQMPILICSILMLQMIQNQARKQRGKQLLHFFSDKLNCNQPKLVLIRLLNGDIKDNEKIMISQLIARAHQENCKSSKCKFCNHETIIYPEQSGGITEKMYKEFLIRKISQKNTSKQHERNNYILQHAILLFDFGWVMKSVKILYQLDKFQYRKLQLYSQRNMIKMTKEKFERQYSQTAVQEQKSELTSQIHSEQILVENLSNITIHHQMSYNFMQKIQIKYLLHIGRHVIKSQLAGNSLFAAQQNIILEFIKEHLETEVYTTECKQDLLLLIQQKIKFYKCCSQHLLSKNINLNQELFNLCKVLYEQSKYWKKVYKQKPSVKLHRLICFLIGEIECNYSKAIAFFKNSKCFDEEQMQNERVKNFNMNRKNIEYIVLELQENMQELNIKKTSRQFFEFYGEKKPSSSNYEFDDLIPINLSLYHEIYVKQFFDDGNCKFYNQFNLNFIKNPHHLITTVNMCFTITNLFRTQNLTFAVFIQEASEDQAFLIVDGKTMACTLTKNLLLLIGWMENEIDLLCKTEKLSNINIKTILPTFSRLLKNKKQQYKVNDVIFLFPLPFAQNKQRRTNRSSLLLSLPERINNKLEYSPVECDVMITKRNVEEYEYFIIDIVGISSQQQDEYQQNRLSMIASPQLPRIVKTEIRFDNSSDGPKIGSINSINYQSQKIFPSITTFGFEIIKLQDQEIQSYNQIQEKSSRNCETFNESRNVLLTSNNMLSPNLNQFDSYSNSISQNKRNQVQKKTKYNEKNTQVDQVNKIYELIQQFFDLESSNHFKKLITTIYFWNILFIAYIIIQIIYINSDLNDFINNIEMMSFNSAIMAPHDLFFSMRFTITTYQDMNKKNLISKKQLTDLTEPYYQYIDLGYFELRDSFYEQFQNRYLQSFLNNINITMNFMQGNSNIISPIETEFRNSLFVLLQYEYDSMRTFVKRQSTSGKPFQISLYSNYFTLHQVTFEVTTQMKDYTINIFSEVQIRWKIIWIIFNILFLLVFLFILYYQNVYFCQLNNFISILNHLTDQDLQKEISKYEQLMSQMKKEDYQFEHYDPEFFLYEKLEQDICVKKKNKEKDYQIRQRNVFDIILVSSFYLLMISYTLLIIINFEQFLSKYLATVDLYEQMQDMRLRPGSLYLYREILFRWSNFTFLTEDENSQLHDLINKGQSSISDYINLQQQINFNDYLLDDEFITFYDQINVNNFCSYIDEIFYDFMQRYCDIALEGSITKGMISSLNYVSNQFRSQQAVNNFTSRIESSLYEQEGAQIITRVFLQMCDQLDNSIQNVTKSLQSLIQIVSYSYLGYILIVQGLLIYYYKPYLGQLVKILKRTVQLIPFRVLITNESLERQLKEMINKFK